MENFEEADLLVNAFMSPPESARPRVWWHWLDGNITKEGIRRDLEWMKRIGIAGLQHFDVALHIPQVVDNRLNYMTAEWRESFRYAAQLADQLDLELAIASSPGWSETGGPWVRPQDAMKKLVWSEIKVPGGRAFHGHLPAPPSVAGPFQQLPLLDPECQQALQGPRFYCDARVLAYPTPRALEHDPKPVRVVTSSDAEIDAAALATGMTNGISLRCSADKPAWILYDYSAPRRFRAASLAVNIPEAFSFALEASNDAETFLPILEFRREYCLRRTTVSFPAISARFLRILIRPAPLPILFDFGANAPGAAPYPFGQVPDGVMMNELKFYGGARIHAFEDKAGFNVPSHYYTLDSSPEEPHESIDPDDVIDITDKMDAAGTLTWHAPEGSSWTVVRLGYSLTGKTNHPAIPEATGLEVDKLDRRAVQAYIDRYIGNFEGIVGPSLIGNRGIRAFLTDSIESMAQNWTAGLIDEFKTRRGYDPKPWLPALTGVLVGDAARSDRFLWDFRRTLMELLSDAHYGQIAASARERGLIYYAESLEGYYMSALGDDLEMRSHADIPMAAIWTSYKSAERDGLLCHVADMRGAASVAHVLGRCLVAAECLTSGYEPWAFSPATLRPIVDLAFALGVNRPVIANSVHQPVEKMPGMTLGSFGQHFTRHETWADFAAPWVLYLSRTSYLLQQGRFVADIAWFYGEEGSLAGLYARGAPADLPEGYGFDFVNAHMLVNDLVAHRGRLISDGGASYCLLYLGGPSDRMTLRVLRKLKELSEANILIYGKKPKGSPSLADDDSEEEYERLVAELWDTGRIVSVSTLTSALASAALPPDFKYHSPTPASHIMFVHRRLADGDIYFLTNRKPRPEQIEAHFRVSGFRPELWRADTGERHPLSWRLHNGNTIVTLDLQANESVFVVFRQRTSAFQEIVPRLKDELIVRLEGHWQLTFQPGRGAPEEALSVPLGSWSESTHPGIRYYSGIGTYCKEIHLDPVALEGRERIILDLGQVQELAEVTLNNRFIGTAWHGPFELDVTDALHQGVNTLVIRVANLWVNRLVGDQQPGALPIAFTVTATYNADAPLRPSGLMGPVVLKRRSTK